tara:strand:- start:197 stop:820 length:624 start_codon:yes stop_codon:yes gene_type:complete
MKSKNHTLFGESAKPDKEHIVQLFYNTIDKAARVTCYASTNYPNLASDIGVRIDELARDDLIIFAISTRRLIEAASFVDRARNISLTLLEPAAKEQRIRFARIGTTTLSRILNLLIHSKTLETFRSETQFRIFAGIPESMEDTILRVTSGKLDSYPPIVLVVSDKGKAKYFSLAELIEIFERCLSEIVDHCAEHNIYLGAEWDFEDR